MGEIIEKDWMIAVIKKYKLGNFLNCKMIESGRKLMIVYFVVDICLVRCLYWVIGDIVKGISLFLQQ
jgi:hypothetical protein